MVSELSVRTGSPAVGSPGYSPNSKRRKHVLSTTTILLMIFSNGVSFLGGAFYASNAAISSSFQQPQQFPNQQQISRNQQECPPAPKCPACPESANQEEEEKECPECPPEKECPEIDSSQMSRQQQQVAITTNGQNSGRSTEIFPNIVSQFAVGMAHVRQENFTSYFDMGVPIDKPNKEGSEGVLILYNSDKAMPFGKRESLRTNSELLSPEKATENCLQMNVIMTDHTNKRQQCIAIVPQYESYHIQKWMRVPEKGQSSGRDPLRVVSRGYSLKGDAAFHPPKHEKHTKKAWKMLETYLDSVDDVVGELKPIVEKIAIRNSIVVMVCNHGQSQLLINFGCAAKAKGLDVSNVLVFATDEETKELAESVGLTAYYDKRNFGNMPTKAAQTYGDGTFTTMMLSKVCSDPNVLNSFSVGSSLQTSLIVFSFCACVLIFRLYASI